MIGLRFSIDNDYFGFEYDKIVEIIPWVPLTVIPGAPDFIPGYFNYRGRIVPVVDLAQLIRNRESVRVLSTRITVIQYDATHLLGLLMENTGEVVAVNGVPADWQSTGVKTEKEFMGKIAVEKGCVIQMVNTEKLLSEQVRQIIFTE